jgi:hypothetical protein
MLLCVFAPGGGKLKTFVDAATVAIPILFVTFLLREWMIGAGRAFPRPKLWSLIGSGGFIVTGAEGALIPALIAPEFTQIHVFDLPG